MSLHLLYPTVFVLWFLLKPIIEKEPCSLSAKWPCSSFLSAQKTILYNHVLTEVGNDIEGHKKDFYIRPVGFIKKFKQSQKI